MDPLSSPAWRSSSVNRRQCRLPEDAPSGQLNGSLLAALEMPGAHLDPFAQPLLLLLQELSLLQTPPQTTGSLGRIFSCEKKSPMSTFPPACSPSGLPPPPPPTHTPSGCLWICEMSPHGTSSARSPVGQRVGLCTLSPTCPTARSASISGTRRIPARVMANLQTWLQSIGQALGTRVVSFVSLPAPEDKRAPPAAPESKEGTLSNLGEQIRNAGLPCPGWDMSLSLTDPEAKRPPAGHACLTPFESLT